MRIKIGTVNLLSSVAYRRALKRKKIAVIFKDQTPAAFALDSLLRELDLEVVLAHSKLSFENALKTRQPDIAFIEAAKLLDNSAFHQGSWRGTPQQQTIIIACAAPGNSACVTQALTAERSDDYLISPFDRALLASKLKCFGLC